MKSKYVQESGTDFDEASDIAIRLKVLAGEIYNAQVNMEWLKTQMFAETAGGVYLDKIASQRGLVRKHAVKSKGTLKFFISEAAEHNVVIPIGTVVATDHTEPVRFVTTEECVITAGTLQASASAEAEKAGFKGNIVAAKATVPVSVPTEITAVINPKSFKGGVDEESDEELRERIRDTYTNQPNGTNSAYYEQLALSIDGIAKARAIPKIRGTGTVDLYVCGTETAASASAKATLQEIVSKERELNVDVLVTDASFTNYDLSVFVEARSGYGEEEITEKCTSAFYRFLNNLPIGGTLYLSALGKALLDTGCIKNYIFDTYMDNEVVSGSQCFKPGKVEITVTQ